MNRTVLFIQGEQGTQTLPAQRYLLDSVAVAGASVYVASPTADTESSLITEGNSTTIRYPSRQGIAGALLALKELAAEVVLVDKNLELLVLDDQVLGPLGRLPEPLADTANFVQTLIPSESQKEYTESKKLATAEPAGPLAMEICWLQIPLGLLRRPDFWGAVSAAAEETEVQGCATQEWVSMNTLIEGLSEAGINARAVYSLPEGKTDFFGRALTNYLESQVPLLPWALFTTDPIYLERWAIVPRSAWDYAKAAGYPAAPFWERLLHTCPPQTWYTNLALLDIWPNTEASGFVNSLSTAVIAHVFYPDMLSEILKYAMNVPSPAELFVTTDTDEKKQLLEKQLREQEHFKTWEVRVVQTNRGRDISAFLLDCSDIITNPEFDVVVKLHSKLSAQDPASVSGWFREHLFQNLLGTAGYATHIWKSFADDPRLGMVFPPVIHMGVPTMGNGWTLNREPAKKLASRLGITVPFDSVTPLSPYGSMFISRRVALEPLVAAAFDVSEFPDAEGYRDGSVAHALERLFSYVVYSGGYYSRCVQNVELAAISATALQYKYDQVSHYLFPFAQRQIKMLATDRGTLSAAQVRQLVQRQLSARFPRVGHVATNAWINSKRILQRVQKDLGRSSAQ